MRLSCAWSRASAFGVQKANFNLDNTGRAREIYPGFMFGWTKKIIEEPVLPLEGRGKAIFDIGKDIRIRQDRDVHQDSDQGRGMFCLNLRQIKRRKMNKHKRKKRLRLLRNNVRARRTVTALKKVEMRRVLSRTVISHGKHTTHPVRARDR